MAIGTIIRILIGLVILLFPPIMVYCTGDNSNWLFILFYPLILFLIMTENICDCENGCIISSYCEIKKKVNFVKNIMIFIGYNKENINSICIDKSDFLKKSYIEIYKTIKDKYELYFETYQK